MALKVLLEVQRRRKVLTEDMLKDRVPPNQLSAVMAKIAEVKTEEATEQMARNDEEEEEIDSPEKAGEAEQLVEKGRSKDWAKREFALKKAKEELQGSS